MAALDGVRRRALAVLAVLVAAVAAVVGGPAAVGTAGGTACAAGEIRVRVAVDFGGLAGAPAGVSDVCVAVADRASGADLLAARARALGTPPPRFEGGFLCAIDGVPETGCGQQTGDGYRYWSYWHGESGDWTYSGVGPAGWRLRDGDVDGWRFLDGGPESKAAPPRTDAASCPAASAPASTRPPTTAPAGAPPLTAAPTPVPDPVPPTALVAPADTVGGEAARSTTTSTARSTGDDGARRAVAARPAAASDDGGGGGGMPIGLLVTIAAIVALSIAAGARFRTGRDT